MKGLVRYEFQIEKETRDRFEDIISETAKELPEPYSLIQRKAKSRAIVFTEMVNKIEHHFFHMKDQIERLKAEIKALAPTIFKNDDKTPIPTAISSLSDDPKQLKSWLAKVYNENQLLKKNNSIQSLELKNAERRIASYQMVVEQQSQKLQEVALDESENI